MGRTGAPVRLMIPLWLALSLFWSLPSRADGVPLRGYVAVNQVLAARLFKPGSAFYLGHYLDEDTGESQGDDLLALMGTYDTNSQFINGTPNGINTLLWYLAFTGLSDDLGAVCDPPGQQPDVLALLDPEVEKMLEGLCAWKDPTVRTADKLQALWIQFLGFDAPYEEFEAFRDFMLGLGPESGHQTVSDATFVMLMNPYFLLRH